MQNKCIGDDTKAATRQSPNCIFKKNMAKNHFQYGTWNSYTLHSCNVARGTGIMTANSSSNSTLQCDKWL